MCCQESGEREATVSLLCPKAAPGEPKLRRVKYKYVREKRNIKNEFTCEKNSAVPNEFRTFHVLQRKWRFSFRTAPFKLFVVKAVRITKVFWRTHLPSFHVIPFFSSLNRRKLNHFPFWIPFFFFCRSWLGRRSTACVDRVQPSKKAPSCHKR